MTPMAMLTLASAFFYCVAMVAMKNWWSMPSLGVTALIAFALLAAGAFEVAALRQERLGFVYVGILGAEVVIIGLASHWHFNEAYTYREVAGIVLVLVGTAIAWT
jgi:multidrug transporter EmrE-like cation transporter